MMRSMPHPDMMLDALIVWAVIFLLITLGLWYQARREAGLSVAARRRFRWPGIHWHASGQEKGLWGRAVEILDDIYVMEWMDTAGWTGRVAKIIAILFITSPVWVLGILWLGLMGRLLGFGLGLFDKVFYR